MNKYTYVLLHNLIVWLFSSIPITLAVCVTNEPKWLWFLIVPLLCTIFVKGKGEDNGDQNS